MFCSAFGSICRVYPAACRLALGNTQPCCVWRSPSGGMRRGATPRATGQAFMTSSPAGARAQPQALWDTPTHSFPSGSLISPPHTGETLTPAEQAGAIPTPRVMLRTGHCYLATAEGCGFNPTRYPAPPSPASFPEEWAQLPSEPGSTGGCFSTVLSFFWSTLLGCVRPACCPASCSVPGWEESWLCHPAGRAAGSLG